MKTKTKKITGKLKLKNKSKRKSHCSFVPKCPPTTTGVSPLGPGPRWGLPFIDRLGYSPQMKIGGAASVSWPG